MKKNKIFIYTIEPRVLSKKIAGAIKELGPSWICVANGTITVGIKLPLSLFPKCRVRTPSKRKKRVRAKKRPIVR